MGSISSGWLRGAPLWARADAPGLMAGRRSPSILQVPFWMRRFPHRFRAPSGRPPPSKTITRTRCSMPNTRDVIILGSGRRRTDRRDLRRARQLEAAGLRGASSPAASSRSPPKSRTSPASAEAIMGPALMDEYARPGRAFGTEFIKPTPSAWTSREAVPGCRRRQDAHDPHALIIATGASAKLLGIPSEARADGPRRVGLRDLRRLLLQGASPSSSSAAATPRWKRRSSSPSSRATSPSSIAATSFARRKIMQERARANPKISFIWDSEIDEILGAAGGQGDRRPAPEREDRRAQRDEDRRASSSAIGHQPNTELFQGQLAARRRGLHRAPARARAPIFRAFSPRATSRTTCTARP